VTYEKRSCPSKTEDANQTSVERGSELYQQRRQLLQHQATVGLVDGSQEQGIQAERGALLLNVFFGFAKRFSFGDSV